MLTTDSAPVQLLQNLALLYGSWSVISLPTLPAEPGAGNWVLQTQTGPESQLPAARHLYSPIPALQHLSGANNISGCWGIASLWHTTPSPGLFLCRQKGSTAENVFAFHVKIEVPKREAKLASKTGNINAEIASHT